MKRLYLLGVLLGLLGLASLASANVMVFDVKLDTTGLKPKIQYRVLDTASSVKIEVFGPLPATTVVGQLTGTANAGVNEVVWTGVLDGGIVTQTGQNYGFRIVASATPGRAGYEVLNTDYDTNPAFDYEYVRGLAVNKNPNSPQFGMVYVSNGRAGLTTVRGKTCSDGIYAFYPDGTDPLGLVATPAAGGVDWTLSSNSPYKLFSDEDGNLWISDWSDAHAGLWRAGSDLAASFTEIFDRTGAATSGLAGSLHGSVSNCFVVKNGANLDLYWQDEDLAGPASPADGLRDIFKLTITPATTFPIPASTVSPVFIDENLFSTYPGFSATLGLFVNDQGGGLRRDAAGNWWVSNYRAVVDTPVLMMFSPNGQVLHWDSLTSGSTGTEPLVIGGTCGFALDPARNMVYVSGSTVFNAFSINPLPVGNLAAAITAVPIPGSTGVWNGGIDVDAAGNVYLGSNTFETVYIFSPPGANSFTTATSLTLPGGAPTPAGGSWRFYD